MATDGDNVHVIQDDYYLPATRYRNILGFNSSYSYRSSSGNMVVLKNQLLDGVRAIKDPNTNEIIIQVFDNEGNHTWVNGYNTTVTNDYITNNMKTIYSNEYMDNLFFADFSDSSTNNPIIADSSLIQFSSNINELYAINQIKSLLVHRLFHFLDFYL